MSDYKRVDCKHIFSNGFEFELFAAHCEDTCTRFRNGRCRIYSAIIKAMFDEKYFPYKDLWEYEGIGGKACKHFTKEHITKPYHRKEVQGQVSIYE